MYDVEKFKRLIKSLISFLDNIDSASYFEQMKYLQQLIDLLENSNTLVFVKEINSAELWGGSGAVWESEYGMTSEQRNHFDSILLELLLSMNEEGIMRHRSQKILNLLNKKSK